MPIRDLRQLSPEADAARWQRALDAHAARDVPLPFLEHWNYSPCRDHQVLEQGCQRCGATFRRHQRTGVTWLYLAKQGLLSDPTGSGKTLIVLGLIALLRQAGELGHEPGRQRAVVVCNAPAQWLGEFRRFTRGIQAIAGIGTTGQRFIKYADPWDVLFLTPETLRMRKIRGRWAGDLEAIAQFRPGLVVYDDVDAMRHPENKTAAAVCQLAETAQRVVGVHATPLQKRLAEIHSFLVPVGGLQLLGPLTLFKHTYVQESVVYTEARDQFGHLQQRAKVVETGVKNGAALKRSLYPLVLRRSEAEIDDLEMPELVASTVWLDPSPQQARRYAELRKGILRKIRDEGETITTAAAMAMFTHGWQICSGLATLDGEEALHEGDSVKLDWAMDRVDGDMAGEDGTGKVVLFINFTPNVVQASRRLTELGIGHVTQWGREASARVRAERLERWRHDPGCRVLIGTTSIERSLNLQAARHLIAVDTILNPARMKQVAGRVRRAGSAHRTVYLHQLLLRGTMEAHFPALLNREAAVADYVWSEPTSPMFQGLTPLQLAQMVTGDPELLAAA